MRYGIKNLCRSGVATLLLFMCVPAFAASLGRDGATVMDGVSLYQVGKAGNLCAITFDDGPSRHTVRLLDILRERGIPATFFMLGKAAERYPLVVKRVLDEGHELANHTYSHKNLRHMPYADQMLEIQRVQDVLAGYGGTPRFVRPPFGRYDPNTVKIAHKLGLKVALWSVDSHDWQRRANVERLESVSGQKAQNGVMLFHDTHEQTVDAMPEILDALIAKQCRFVTMSQFAEYIENPPLLQALAAELAAQAVAAELGQTEQPVLSVPAALSESLESLESSALAAPSAPSASSAPAGMVEQPVLPHSTQPQPAQQAPTVQTPRSQVHPVVPDISQQRPVPSTGSSENLGNPESLGNPDSADSTGGPNVFMNTFQQMGNWAQELMGQGD